MHNESEYRGFMWRSFHRAVTISVLPEEVEALHNLLLDKAEDDIKLAAGSSGSRRKAADDKRDHKPKQLCVRGLNSECGVTAANAVQGTYKTFLS